MERGKYRWMGALLLLTLALNWTGLPAGAMVFQAPEETGEAEEKAEGFTLELGELVIEEGQCVEYSTVSSEVLSAPADGLYPGELTVTLTGPVTIRSGGVLSIGKYAAGGPEPSPLIQGELIPEGLIRVEPGGVLEFNDVTLELEGEGLFILQEEGAKVELFDTPVEEDWCSWGGAVVDNRYVGNIEVPLAQGRPLTEEDLPQRKRVWYNDRGRSKLMSLALLWDMAPAEGVREGELTLSGTYLNEEGEPLPALERVEACVHWYPPEEIVLVDSGLLGETAVTARLGYLPPEGAVTYWGEVSRDEGKSWEKWENCVWDGDGSYFSCTFYLVDAEPQQYRLAAEDEEGVQTWFSKGVTLPEEGEGSDDQGGNRGGSTTPVAPSREPEPAPSPSSVPESTPLPDPAPSFTPGPTATPDPEPEEREEDKGGKDGPVVRPKPRPTPRPTPTPSKTPEPVLTLPPAPIRTPEPDFTPIPEPEPTERLPLAEESPVPTPGTAALSVMEEPPDPPPEPTATLAPTPAPRPPAPTPVPVDIKEVSIRAVVTPAPSPEDLPAPTPAPLEEKEPEPSKMPEVPAKLTPAPAPMAAEAEPTTGRQLPAPVLQALLVAGGLGLCVAAGLCAAGAGAFKRKKR